jgi:hypothetical protein
LINQFHGSLHVTSQLLFQLFNRAKRANLAELVEKVNLQCLTVQRALKANQVRFHLNGKFPECGIGTDVYGCGPTLTPIVPASRVDAVGWKYGVDGFKVASGKTNLGAAGLTVRYHAADAIGLSQQHGRIGDLTGQDKVPNAAARDVLSAKLQRLDDLQYDSGVTAKPGQHFRVSPALVPKEKIRTFDNGFRCQPVNDDLLKELVGAERQQLLIRRINNQRINT